MSVQLTENSRLFSACRKCYNLKPSIICETSSGECVFRHYDSSSFFLSELKVRTNQVVLTQYSEIRPFADQRTTILCSSYIPMQWSLCPNGDRCTSAHNKEELCLWKFAEENRLNWNQVCKSIQGTLADSTFREPLFHCQLCNLNFDTDSLFSDHCDSRQHRKLLKSVPLSGWKHRAPPELKSSSTYYMCRHVNTCPNGESCADAHSPAEFQEWKKRVDFLNRKLEFSKEQKLLSFADRIILEYEKTSSYASVLAKEIPGIKLKMLDNKAYGRSCLPEETVEWKIKLTCSDKKMQLQHVGFLGEDTMFSLSRTSNRNQGRFSSHVNFLLSTCNDPNLGNGAGSFQVKFTAQRELGAFHDNLVFEFLDRPRPALVAKFSVEVVNVKQRAFTDATMEKKPVLWEGTRPIVPFNDQLSPNKVQRSLDDLLVKYKPPEVALEHASGDLRDFEVPDLDSKTLTADNYVRRMHEFLYHEETARSRALKKLNCSSRLTVAKTYTSVDGGMNIAEEGKLFAKFCPLKVMNRDLDEGLLFLEHCSMVLLGLRSNEEALPVYQAGIAEKSPDHVWLRLSQQCVEDWELYDGTSTYCDIHLQLERQLFCTAHYALDQLDELDRVSLLFPQKRTNSAHRTRDSERKKAEYQRKLQLNEQQMAIFEESALDSPGMILVALGPFGTGKTYTIGKCVMHLVETRPDSKILICTHSNSAADLYIQNHFAGQSTKNGIVRIYYHNRNTRTVLREVQDCCLFDEENGGFRYPSTQEIISDQVRVVVTTFATSIALGLMGTGLHGVFTHIFLDEGSQAMEAEAIIPLTLASSNKTTVVVAGDHLQISQKIYSKKFGSESDYTLVERLYTMKQNFVFLTSNYRCVRPILQLTEKIFYRKGLLKSCSDEVVLSGLEPVQFHHVQGTCKQDPSTCGFKNVEEAAKIVEIVGQLLDNYQGVIHEEDISVVSSYFIQVATIRSLMKQAGKRRVDVQRVRNIQGREFKIIIISCVHRRGGIDDKTGSSFGLLSDVGLLNTAITRSKIAVIAVGDAATVCSIGECQHRWNVFLMNCAILPRGLSLATIREEVASISTLNPNAAGFQLRRSSSRSSGLGNRFQTQRSEESSDDEDNLYGAYDDTTDSETDSEEFVVNDKILNEIFASQSGERTDKLDEKEIEQPGFSGDLRHLLKQFPETHKHCVVDMKTWDSADAVPVKREHRLNKIVLNSRKNIGRVFDGDEVVVKIVKRVAPNGPVYGKVLGVLESNLESVEEREFVCIPEMPFQRNVITVMRPIDRKSPKLAILKPKDIGPYEIGVYRMNKSNDDNKQQPIKCFKRVKVNRYSYTTADGKLFVVKYLRWNEDGYFPFGYVSRVVSASKALECIAIKCQIPPKHKKALEKSSMNLKDENSGHRIDETKLFVFTIDPPTAIDLDDAFSVEKCSQPGHKNCYKIGVHICDVASIVAKLSDVDKEAAKRVRSFYDSDGSRASSMLPESILTQCSLSEMKTRRAVSTFFHTSQQLPDIFTESGRFPDPQLTAVRSKKQLSYPEAQELLQKAFGESGQRKILKKSDEGSLHLQIYELWKFFMSMRKKRLDIALYGVDHKDESLEKFREEGAARLLVEEAMNTVNACSALYLSRKCSDFTLRCQAKPDRKQATSWSRRFADGINLSVNLQSWQKHMLSRNQSQHMPDEVPIPQSIAILNSVWSEIDKALGSGDFLSALMLFCCDNLQPAISPAANNFISIQQRAVEKNSDNMWQDMPTEQHSHFRLRLPYYAQCTSPMRRYLDLHMQRQIVKYCKIGPSKDKEVVPLNHLPENEPLKKFCHAELASEKKETEFHASMSSYRFATSMEEQENRNYKNVIVTQVTSKDITVKLPGVQGRQEYTIPYTALHTQISKWKANKNVALGPRGEKYLFFNNVKWFKRFYDLSKDARSPQVVETGGKMQRHVVDGGSFLELTNFLKANLPKKTLTDLKPHIVTKLRAISASRHEVMGCDSSRAGQGPCINRTCDGRDSPCPDHMSFWTKNKIKHCRVVSMEFEEGASLHVQLFARTDQMLLTPSIQLLCLADNFDLCLMHQQFAVETFASDVRPAHVPPEYRSVEEYVEKWLPVLRLDGVFSAVRDGASITYDKVDISWDTRDSSGSFFVDSWFLKERFAYIEKDDFICIRYCNVQSVTTGNLYTWVAHALITHVERGGDSGNDTVHFRLCKTAVGSQKPDVTRVSGKLATVEHILYQMPHRWMATCLNQVEGISSSSIPAMLCCDRVRRQDRYPNLNSVNYLQRQFVDDLVSQVLPGFSNPLNEGQMEQAKRALVNRLTLIQGPPGTGKSFLGAHLVYFFHTMKQLTTKSQKKKIMYCGPSNKSVDVVAGYLLESGLSVLRVYSKTMEELAYPNILKPKIGAEMRDRPPDSLKRIALHEKIRTSGSYAQQIVDYEARFKEEQYVTYSEYTVYLDLLKKAKQEEISRHDIIICTCTTAAVMKKMAAFSHCIVDEAGMCSEPETLVPVVMSDAEQVVLIGDHMQLQPVIHCRRASNFGLGTSMFERLKDNAGMLTTQYRMSEEICEFPSETFYEGKLRADPSVAERDPGVMQVDGNRAFFVHLEGEEKNSFSKHEHGGENSKYNEDEAKAVVTLLRWLHEKEQVELRDVMILTPYNAQVFEIKKLLDEKHEKLRNVHVGTVVTSQGSERDYIIFSTVRSQPPEIIEPSPSKSWCNRNLGFVTNPHQINVAITRAKRGLCIIGNRHLLSCDRVTWEKLLDDYNRRGGIVPFDLSDAPWNLKKTNE